MKALVLISWLTLGLFYYWLSIDCCVREDVFITPVEESSPAAEVYSGLLAFEAGKTDPVTTDKTNDFLLSKVSVLEDDQILRIIGQYGESESAAIGSQRASAIADLINRISDDTPFELAEERMDLDTGRWVEAYRFEVLDVAPPIVEIDDRTLIYFPYNSTEQILDEEVTSYLSACAKRVGETGEKVYLTGHTDSFGEATYNYQLGIQRAKVVKRYLVQKGVDAQLIQIDSKGESDPIAPNSTADGRSRNRRTELIIK